MNETLSAITKLQIAGLLSESARQEVEKRLMALAKRSTMEASKPLNSN